MAGTKNKINLTTEVTLTLKTIITVAVTVAGMLWGYHEAVLFPKIDDVKKQVDKVDSNVTWIMQNLSGLGDIDKSNGKIAEKPPIQDSTRTAGGLNH